MLRFVGQRHGSIQMYIRPVNEMFVESLMPIPGQRDGEVSLDKDSIVYMVRAWTKKMYIGPVNEMPVDMVS